jgi:competence protein ComEC
MLVSDDTADAKPSRLTTMLLGERQRLPLWLPVLLGLGVALYFAWPGSPPLAVLIGAALAAAILMAIGLGRGGYALAALVPALVLAELAIAGLRTTLVDEPMLSRKLGPVDVSGRVVLVEPRKVGVRAVIDEPAVEGLAPAVTPRRVRLVINAPGEAVVPGAHIGLRAVLMPPPRPAAPGAYDFGRALYYKGIGAVGYAVSRAEPLTLARPSGWREAVAGARLVIAMRIDAAMDGHEGAIAVALLTGLRGRIPDDISEVLRDAGLAHLLAISGLHLGLVAGFAFFLVRFLLAAVEPLALAWPIKKVAAVVALAAAFTYLLLTGATVPTQRAFIMAGLVLFAVLIDREAISMRPVAWAALLVLTLRPESLLGASFQMSFAAVVALVAFYEAVRRWRPVTDWAPSPGRRVLLYVGAVAATTVVASLATAPFAAFHFGRIASLGLVANLVAVPITALWIMPWGLLGLLLMPLGLESLALLPMEWGIAAVVAVARACAALPGAVTLVPAWPVSALGLIALGGLWLCLWRLRWRWFSLAAMAAGLLVAFDTRPPDLLVDESGRLFAVRGADGRLALSSRRVATFVGDNWLRRAGQDISPAWPGAGESWPDGSLRCDGLGCLYRSVAGPTVALIKDPRAIAEDCAAADILVSLVPVRRACSDRPFIDRFDLWRHGAHAMWLETGEQSPLVQRAVDSRRGRPWARDLSSDE